MNKIRWILITIMMVMVISACGTNKSVDHLEDVSEINSKISQIHKVETFPYYYASESEKLIDYYEKVMNGEINEYCYVDLSSDNQYKRCLNNTEYVYFGELKDNYPNGIGVVFKRMDTGLGSFYIIYTMSDFEKGYVDGYSLCYDVAEELENIQIKFKDDYEGYYKKGKVEGDGIIYNPGTVTNAYINLSEDIDMLIIDNLTILSNVPLSQYCVLYMGENNGLATGNGVIYSSSGKVIFVGEVEEGYKIEGREYFVNGQLQYEGEYKNNFYHGKGVLYDENGDVIHDGKFKYGEID